jgi:hypothetical protein
MNKDGVCVAPRLFFCPSCDGSAVMKLAFAQNLQNVALWKANNDISKTFFGEISSFALLIMTRWVKCGADPVRMKVQTITKESPVAPVDWVSQLFLHAFGVYHTGDIVRDIYAGVEYEKMVNDWKKQQGS